MTVRAAGLGVLLRTRADGCGLIEGHRRVGSCAPVNRSAAHARQGRDDWSGVLPIGPDVEKTPKEKAPREKGSDNREHADKCQKPHEEASHRKRGAGERRCRSSLNAQAW